jgi:CRP/FNR family transcriptional regulator
MTNDPHTTSLLDLPALAELLAATPATEYKHGTPLFRYGDTCSSLPVLVSGTARVYLTGNNERQATLYRLRPGQVCPVALASLLRHRRVAAEAATETAARVCHISGDELGNLARRFPELASLLLDAVTGRLDGLLDTTQQALFVSLDIRLARLLERGFRTNPDGAIRPTHQAIANELGTSRVVISRLLKRMERAGCIRLSRKTIELGDAQALAKALDAAADLSNEARPALATVRAAVG